MATKFGRVHVGCHSLLGAIAGVPLVGCRCWVPLLGAIAAIARCHAMGAIAVVPLLGAMVRCHCWVPLLGAIVGCHGWMPLLVPLLRAIARNHCEKKLTRVLHRSPLHFLCIDNTPIGLCYLGSMLVYFFLQIVSTVSKIVQQPLSSLKKSAGSHSSSLWNSLESMCSLLWHCFNTTPLQHATRFCFSPPL